MNVMDGSGNGAIFFLLPVVFFCGRCIAVASGIFLRQMYCSGRCIAVVRCIAVDSGIFSRQLEGSNDLHRPRFPGKSVAVGILKVPSGAKIQQNRGRWTYLLPSTGLGLEMSRLCHMDVTGRGFRNVPPLPHGCHRPRFLAGVLQRQMYCSGRCIAADRGIFSRQLEGSNGLHRPRFPGKSVAVGILKVPSGAKIQQNRARWKVKDMSTGRGY